MRKLAIACVLLGLSVVLAGCQTIQTALNFGLGFSINREAITAVEAGYNVVLTFMVEYRCRYDNRPSGCITASGTRIPQNRCAAGQGPSFQNGFCASRVMVERMQRADRVVQDALDKVIVDYNTCVATTGGSTCTGVQAAWSTLQTAIATAKALAAEIGWRG